MKRRSATSVVAAGWLTYSITGKLSCAAVVLGALVASGCSAPMLSGGEDLRREIRVLEQRIVELQRKAAVSEVEIGRLQRRIAELESARATASVPSGERADPAPPLVPSSSPDRAAAPRSERDASEAPRRPGGVESAPSVEIESERSTPVAVESSSVGEPISPAAQALYDRGYTLYHQGSFVEAEASFARFLQGFPNSELADNAQYWIGEARYSRGDYRGALAAFREAVDRYPEGNKVPDALLKAGQCLEELGDVGGARITYGEVQRRFPDTATALIAAERLSSLGD